MANEDMAVTSDAHTAIIGSRMHPRLLSGTIVVTDLLKSREFYEQFLGFECVRYASNRMLLRDRRAAAAMQAGKDDCFVIDVEQVSTISHPQRLLHHWGFDVSSTAEVDRIHVAAAAMQERFGIRKITPVSQNHGAHSFYFADRDMNWWEIECRLDGLDNEGFFARGDMYPTPDESRSHQSGGRSLMQREFTPANAIAGDLELTHGTCEQRALDNSRAFLEQVLGLRCVRHLKPAQMFAGRSPFSVFAIELPRVKEQPRQNRWIIGVAHSQELESTRARAQAHRDKLGIREIGPVEAGSYGTAFIIQDADGNWWEVAHCDPGIFRARYDRGDID
jgi:catechol 2,3-dioxygenase-like lactoylglutathione lyase family enzyme